MKNEKPRPFADMADRLIWHRELMGLSQAEFADRIKFKRSTYGNWESGAFQLSLEGGRAIRETFGLSLDFLFEGIDDALPITLRRAWRERPSVSESRKSIVNPDA